MGRWYKNMSASHHSVPVGGGLVVSVPPRGVVEVHHEGSAVARMVASRVLHRCAAPAGAKSRVPEPLPEVRPKVSEFAKSIEEGRAAPHRGPTKPAMEKSTPDDGPKAEVAGGLRKGTLGEKTGRKRGSRFSDD